MYHASVTLGWKLIHVYFCMYVFFKTLRLLKYLSPKIHFKLFDPPPHKIKIP